MVDLFHKCREGIEKDDRAARAKVAEREGWYPYFKAIESGADTEVYISGKKMIMIGSNNYLGLTQDSRVKEASIKALERFGSGCTGSRFLNGTLTLHEELEERLAEFMQFEAALIFSTGFQTNQGTISTIVGKDDIVFGDRENHASIVDACRLSFGKFYKYRHNDMDDLRRLISNTHNNSGGKLIVSDGVYSMGGDIVNLPYEIAEAY